MALDDYTYWLLYRARIKEWLREAERDRLARLMWTGRDKGDRFHCRAFAWLGERLVTWGLCLQQRYGSVEGACIARSRPGLASR